MGGQDFSWADARPCSARLVTQGHSSLSWRGDGSRVSPTGGELWGLASHPSKSDVFATAGDDGMLRLWHADKKCLLGYLLLSQVTPKPQTLNPKAIDNNKCLLGYLRLSQVTPKA